MLQTLAFSDLVYFLETAATGNISRAAERLGITQPSLSAAVKRLESNLQVTLFLRSRSGVQLTKSGQELHLRAREMITQWELLRSELVRRETAVSGHYTLGCHPSVALFSLPAFLPQLLEEHPGLSIKLVHDLSRIITEKVISFEVDFGIVVNPVAHADLVITPLCQDDVKFWISRKHDYGSQLQIENEILICDDNLHQSQTLLDALRKKKISFKKIVTSSNLEVVAELTASGMGIGILPERVAQNSFKNGNRPDLIDVATLPGAPTLPIFKDRIALIYRADTQKTFAGRTIIQTIKQASI